MDQSQYFSMVRGYDVIVEVVSPEDITDDITIIGDWNGENAYKVGVLENEGAPWEIIIAVDLDSIEGDNEDLDGSDELMDHVSNAAVDIFEAERGTLGEGAGSIDNDGVVAMKKRSLDSVTLDSVSVEWEDWFYKMRGTPFEEEATKLLEQLIAAQLNVCESKELESLNQELAKVLYDLDMLNLRRMKESLDEGTVIIISAANHEFNPHSHKCYACGSFGCFEGIEAYLEKFQGLDLEVEAISKIQEFLDIKDRINSLWQEPTEWEKRIVQEQEIRNKMEELLLTLLQQNAMPSTPGVGTESNLAKDMMELVRGVEIPVAPSLGDIGRDPLPIDRMVDSMEQRKDPEGGLPPVASGVKLAFEEVEPVEDRIDELGSIRNDLDPALIEKDQYAFNVNEHVELKEEIEALVGWGVVKKYPKGTKGCVETQYDKHGDYFQVRLEDNQLLKVRWDQIKSVAK